jgi:O-antigen ligase
MVYVTAVFYYVLSIDVWSNPNSLGLIMGVMCWPVCLWRFLLGNTTAVRMWQGTVLFLCASLLFSSSSRAAMLAAFVVSVLLLSATKRYRVMLAGAFLVGAFLAGAYLLVPAKFESTSERLVYKKGARSEGILKSRQEPWEKAVASFKEHPWLGTGFGVSKESAVWHGGYEASSTTRERGSSYLTLLEGTGLLGTLTFGVLLATLLWYSFRALARLRAIGHPNYAAAPIACVIVGALVHAGFEDWLFAVGYYMTIVFWLMAMSLPDVLSDPAAYWPSHFLGAIASERRAREQGKAP